MTATANETYLLLGLLVLILAALSAIAVSLHRLLRRSDPRRLRVVLPMSSGVDVKTNTSAQVTSRPQQTAFRPERLIIGGKPEDWIVNDVKIKGRSQFNQSGDVPGEMFSSGAIDCFLRMEAVGVGMDFQIVVTYIGERQAPFVCGVIGTEIATREVARAHTLDRPSSLGTAAVRAAT